MRDRQRQFLRLKVRAAEAHLNEVQKKAEDLGATALSGRIMFMIADLKRVQRKLIHPSERLTKPRRCP